MCNPDQMFAQTSLPEWLELKGIPKPLFSSDRGGSTK